VSASDDLSGSSDAFDSDVNMVVDWKVVGDKSLAKLPHDMSLEYETQAHIYGLGYENAGYTVEWVRICLLTRSSHDFRCPGNGPARTTAASPSVRWPG
jgi:hypothetical protein